MTNRQLYHRMLRDLSRPAAPFELRQLFKHYLDFDPVGATGERELAEEEAIGLLRLAARLEDGEPLQYLMGVWEFYGLPFLVGPGVLIPRPDTETLVRVALELLEEQTSPRVVDLCSGSGAIAVAIAKNHGGARLRAVEASKSAFEFLGRNIILNGVETQVEALFGDATEPLRPPPVDMIVSNPPYLTRDEMAGLPAEVSHEPAMALDGGPDGLRFYRAITEVAKAGLRPGGALLYEVGYTQAGAVADIMALSGFTSVGYTEDYGGIPRCVWGFWGEAP